MTIEYLICFLASIGLLIAYALMVKNKEFWLTMLYICLMSLKTVFLPQIS